MHDANDMDLLRQFAVRNSDSAFATLVERHVNLVYSAALRKTGNPHAAEEITQAVFIILAQKAGRIPDKTILPGWLYQTARLTAASFLKREIRRVRREQEAYMRTELNRAASDETWRQLAPLLDDAMGQLGEKDRAAVVLRFFGGKSFAEVGAAAGVSENAAKKRVSHALEKLHRYFSKHGVNSTTALIAGTISTNSLQAAPVGLAQTISAVAIAKGAAAGGSTLALVKGALKIMAWTKMKTAVIAGAVVLLAAGTTTTFLVQHKSHGLHGRSPQIHIKARFIEIPKGSDGFLNSFSGILDASSARTLLQTIGSKRGVEALAEPEIITVSGRQSQMRATQPLTIVTNFIYHENNSIGGISPQIGKAETGPVLEVVPVVLRNGQIQMTVIASITEFLGYADNSKLNDYTTNSAGQQVTLPAILPVFQIKKAMTTTTLADGQGLLLIFPKAEQVSFSTDVEREARVAQHIADAEKKNGEKTTIVLVTVDLLDAVGNKIHPDAR